MRFSSHLSHPLSTTSHYYDRPFSMAEASTYAPFASLSNPFSLSEFPNSAQESQQQALYDFL